jgi:hypothetical protein
MNGSTVFVQLRFKMVAALSHMPSHRRRNRKDFDMRKIVLAALLAAFVLPVAAQAHGWRGHHHGRGHQHHHRHWR